MQHLVIRSALAWVLEREEQTVVVIPEAWKFLPQGRGTPVKLAAEAFIRQAAALHNYLWLDSQDLGGVEKLILRSVPVWILGVQREANEIKRTLENIPASTAKPKPADVATLELGQFYACWGKHAVKTYVQPTWMPAVTAAQVARGDVALTRRDTDDLQRFDRHGRRSAQRPEEEKVNAAEAADLRRENEQLRSENTDLRRRLEVLERGTAAVARVPTKPVHVTPAAADPFRQLAGATPLDNDALYQQLLAQLVQDAAKDPLLLRVLVTRPELEVHVERKVVEVDGNTLRGRLARLIQQGFFDTTIGGTSALGELNRRGIGSAKPNVYRELDRLVTDGFLTKEDGGYRVVPGMKINIVEVG
jgi:hypothetical protein